MTLTAGLLERLLVAYPALRDLPSAELDALSGHDGRSFVVPAGTMLFDEGGACQGFPLVLEGAVRVARGSSGGRRLELYRVLPGETCVVSTAGLLDGQPLTARGESVAETTLVLVSPAAFERWCAEPAFRRHVFGMFSARLADLMALAEAVAFQRLDQRLAQALLAHGPVLSATHQALADELGTVREIVSRLLNRFEREGWVALGRERIEVRDAEALRGLLAGDGGARDGPA